MHPRKDRTVNQQNELDRLWLAVETGPDLAGPDWPGWIDEYVDPWHPRGRPNPWRINRGDWSRELPPSLVEADTPKPKPETDPPKLPAYLWEEDLQPWAEWLADHHSESWAIESLTLGLLPVCEWVTARLAEDRRIPLSTRRDNGKRTAVVSLADDIYSEGLATIYDVVSRATTIERQKATLASSVEAYATEACKNAMIAFLEVQGREGERWATTNVGKEAGRHRTTDRLGDEADHQPKKDADLEQDRIETKIDLMSSLCHNAKERRILEFSFEGDTHEEIADRLGIPPKRVAKVLDRLKRQIEENLDLPELPAGRHRRR